ncbi:hypothetical protein HYU89_01085 [Candidatus Collierbacteria bacterium]|nr:hypothetical protein [Candidatus Collierbacteria bacterium]
MTPKFSHSLSYHESAKLQTAYLPALIGAMIFLVIFAGFVPGFNSWKQNSVILKQRQEINSVLSSKASMLTSLDSTELQSKLDLATKALPIKSPYRQTLAAMSVLADRHKIIVDGLEFIKQGEGLGIKIIAAGTYPDIYSFLQAVENTLPLASVNVVNLNVRSAASDFAEKTYSAELNFSFYFQSSPKTFGKLTEKLPVISVVGEKNLRELQGFEFFDLKSAALSVDGSNRATKLFPD